jgi:Zn-finger in ubiquitin-hydrolases and other protein
MNMIRTFMKTFQLEHPDAKNVKKEGTDWVALRLCLICGHVGCCHSSVGLHATSHLRTQDTAQ